MKEPISVSEDDYNGAIQNFLFWLTRQESFKEKMDKDKVSSLVFQVRWDFVKNKHGESILWAYGRGTCHEMESDLLFTNQKKKGLVWEGDKFKEPVKKRKRKK